MEQVQVSGSTKHNIDSLSDSHATRYPYTVTILSSVMHEGAWIVLPNMYKIFEHLWLANNIKCLS